MGTSQNKRHTIEILDLSYFFGDMLVSQNIDNDDGLISMAEELKNLSLSALKLCDCHIITEKQIESIRKRLESVFHGGFKTGKVPCAAFAFFLINQLEKILHIPKRANGQPKKNGWIKCKTKRTAFQNVLDLIIGMSLLFDPEYEDIENAEKSKDVCNHYFCLIG